MEVRPVFHLRFMTPLEYCKQWILHRHFREITSVQLYSIYEMKTPLNLVSKIEHSRWTIFISRALANNRLSESEILASLDGQNRWSIPLYH